MHKPNCLLLFFLLIGFLMGCSEIDDKNYDQAILGIWYQSSPVHGEATRSYRNEYHFKKDGTFEYSLKLIKTEGDKETELGYMTFHEGNFQVLENTLLYKQVHYYGLNNENEMLPREELVLHHSGVDTNTYISFNKKRDKLTMGKPCPPNAMCMAAQTYNREN